METENKIVRYFIENKRKLTIRELAKNLKLDYKIVHTASLRLVKKGLLGLEKIGQSSQLSFINKFSKEVLEAELKRREEILGNKDILIVMKSINEKIKSVNYIALLFGSYAKKNYNKKSDIDLIFIVPSEDLEKKIEKIISLMPLKIHYFVFTEEQFLKMNNSKEPNIIHEAVKNNILLYGVEQYYNLIGGMKYD
jgi:predicted nucleotidyltransferase/predicted DNA-binding transcriptional regulator